MGLQMGNTIDNNGTFPRPGTRLGLSGGLQPLGARPAGPKPPGSNEPAGANGQEHVQFSDSVALLQRLQEQLDAEPVVDSSRVAAARSSIEAGSYEVDYSGIADRLIAADKELP